VEPPRPKPPEPKSGVSTSFTTPALRVASRFDLAVYNIRIPWLLAQGPGQGTDIASPLDPPGPVKAWSAEKVARAVDTVALH
ncbi:MAG: hypothetical protein WED13_02660, partial [Methyloceanibacter sp.]